MYSKIYKYYFVAPQQRDTRQTPVNLRTHPPRGRLHLDIYGGATSSKPCISPCLVARSSISVWRYSHDKTTIIADVTLLTNMELCILSHNDFSQKGDNINTTAP